MMEKTSKNFELLVCGNTSENMFEFQSIIKNLNSKIKLMTEFVINYDWNNGRANVDIPFYCRNILESVMTALLGRFDPFRLLIVYKVQLDPEYDLGKRAQVAVEWTGDIIAKNSPKSKPWYFENKIDTFERAILGNYYGEIVWKPAFRKLIDFVSERGIESQWLDEIVSLDENQNFEKLKSTAIRLFSSFSKGVHSECLIDIDVVLDEVTVKQLAIDLFKVCVSLSLASHFVDFCTTQIDILQALNIFLEIEEMISNELQ